MPTGKIPELNVMEEYYKKSLQKWIVKNPLKIMSLWAKLFRSPLILRINGADTEDTHQKH